MSPAELYGKVILVDEFGLIVTICLYPSLLPNFKFSESMSAVFLLRKDKAKHEDNRQETTRIYNRKNYDKVAND